MGTCQQPLSQVRQFYSLYRNPLPPDVIDAEIALIRETRRANLRKGFARHRVSVPCGRAEGPLPFGAPVRTKFTQHRFY